MSHESDEEEEDRSRVRKRPVGAVVRTNEGSMSGRGEEERTQERSR